MFRITIRALAGDAGEPLATGTGVTWEEAAFRGYDQVMRSRGVPRRYLACVEAEPYPGRKIVRFGRWLADRARLESDPEVAVDVDPLVSD